MATEQIAADSECSGGGCGKCCGEGKPCATGGCREDCVVSCNGSETFGDEERLRRLVEYREMLQSELDSVEVAIAAMQASCAVAGAVPGAVPGAPEDQELMP
jgi:hypothetical protein